MGVMVIQEARTATEALSARVHLASTTKINGAGVPVAECGRTKSRPVPGKLSDVTCVRCLKTDLFARFHYNDDDLMTKHEFLTGFFVNSEKDFQRLIRDGLPTCTTHDGRTFFRRSACHAWFAGELEAGQHESLPETPQGL